MKLLVGSEHRPGLLVIGIGKGNTIGFRPRQEVCSFAHRWRSIWPGWSAMPRSACSFGTPSPSHLKPLPGLLATSTAPQFSINANYAAETKPAALDRLGLGVRR